MSDVVIGADGLGKKYRIQHLGQRQQYVALRDVFADKALAPWRWLNARRAGSNGNAISAVAAGRSTKSEDFWALKDVSFEVKRGEVIGIIGRNGAGKSTLLKILSRITEPTTGRVRISGRVASLLEVGTGFHPELTGAENVFLNGAILGMSRAEIKRRFDEIVAFGEIDKFLDTPVKRYSSGMYVRLAFAVAAHLEPEILVIDEVLAVGDAEFQKKCLGKMDEVAAKDGRTILFVSHNVQAVRSLCGRCLLLDKGSVAACGPSGPVIGQYLNRSSAQGSAMVWEPDEAPGNATFSLLGVRVLAPDGSPQAVLSTRSDVWIEMEFYVFGAVPSALCVGFDLMTSDGIAVLRTYQTDSREEDWPGIQPGLNRFACRIPAGLLNGGAFGVCPRVSIHNVEWIVHIDSVVRFELVLDHGVSPLWSSLTPKGRSGLIAPVLTWTQQSPAAV
jgi:lipopolysaccharide transport system ATP-binding protein